FFSNNIKLKENNDLKLNIHYGLPDEESMIFSDEFRLKQVLTNLIGNAIKFTEKGSIEFGYIIRPDEKFLKFYVKDTGIGIPENKKEVIFARFRQADDSASRQYGGTGLGLAISKGLIELLGGEIWLESNKDKGSKFYFTVPYLSVHDIQNKIITSETEISSNYDWHDKKILIVEDDESSFIFLKHLFQKTNITIKYAQSGIQAIKICQEYKDIDLVLMDLNLPEMNGYDATKEIKKQKSNLPIIALTAFNNEETEEECLKQGFDKFMTKPYNEELILKTVNDFFSSSHIKV
ncbi:ATP-binding protein, partial [Bacteroidota bacterium]